MKETNPHFAFVNMLPCFVYGPAHGHDPFGINNSSNQCAGFLRPLSRPIDLKRSRASWSAFPRRLELPDYIGRPSEFYTYFA